MLAAFENPGVGGNIGKCYKTAESLVLLAKQCRSTKTVQQVHTQMVVNSIHNHHNHLLSKAIQVKNFTYASLIFSHMAPHPNDYAFNIMIRALTTTWHNYPLALTLFYRMKSLSVTPNNFTFPFFFLSCANLAEISHARVAHSLLFKVGLHSDPHSAHSLITAYARCDRPACARKVFDEIPQRDLVSWNSMIAGYAKAGCAREAVELFGEMGRRDGFEPDEMSLVSVLGACGELGDLELGSWVEGFVVERGMALNSFLGSALISMYAKCGDLGSARRIFDSMATRDVITWNAVISGYAQNGMADEAISLFHAMKDDSVKANKITLTAVLSACATIGALDLGKQIDEYASQRGFQHDIFVATALIDMYAKCGSLESAQRVFKEMPQKNEVSWNAMISALASHGKAKEALSLFQRMSDEGGGARPNDITFVGLLSACVHAGLVAEGHRLFDMMSTLFRLVPKIEHYSCMVDLLARAGHLYEAWDLIEEMPEKPDKVTLGALLGACRRNKNVDIGERVMRMILEVDPSNSGNYIISSKIYANLNMWEDSARMRLLMRQKGITKTPGCSWIEIENQLYEFLAGDGSCLDSIDISNIIYLLYEELKREGYLPNVVE
ncbi:pentatricopeptide repeat-containing protein At2g34400 isoform X1 [Vigna radiata var. radiata]|uniref:Pentatricopeptide repeat-containing protein At2g34400 isoform X1 n=1 Tax=Vigna radiata var. radiata TaxID=3916 RepID=A0A1S3UCT8_VIGRR|nr:pentatricopeptide repeat-containing protein At2g34400 isoform X1 [Vigna radiata var. radiata]XP_022637704.1 pentatricopeptide repeat-containing protein At2g34400 isoform X1 [Vigna radiata var. radiata]